MLKPLLIAIGLATAVLSGCATPTGIGDSLGLSPHWDWKTIETEHFRVSFPKELSDVANRTANYYEEVHRLLSPRLQWAASYKVTVLVVDHEDSANGMTSPVGRFGMILMVTPPDNWFSTYYYDDWLRLLVLHEYAHFLNMDITLDLYEAARYVFGDVVLPNSVWPSWMLEGLAVYMETRLTKSGRGRSPLYEMILRAAVEQGVLDSDRFVTIDRMNGTNPYYPAGETAYLFGYQMMNRLASSGEPRLGDLSYQSGRRLPYFINDHVQSLSGKDWYALWDDWSNDVRVRAAEQLKRIHSKPLTRYQKLTEGGKQTLGSDISPDGKWIAYTQDTLDRRMSLYLRNLENGETRIVDRKILGASVSFTADSGALLFSSLRRNTNYTLYSDLAVYELSSGKITWLSNGLRARDPSVSADGKRVVFTTAGKARIGLVTASLEKHGAGYRLGPVEELFTPPLYDATYTPKFSRDGRKVIFTYHRNGVVAEDLMEIDLETKKPQALVADGSFNRFPAVHPNGDIYFVSDRSGVENLYVLPSGKKAASAVTNLTTGISFPTFGPDGKLFANVFSFTGWDLALVDRKTGELAEVPSIDRAPAPPALTSTEAAFEQKEYDVSDYSVFPSILPRQWAPLLLLRNSGSMIGAQALGFDSVDRHRYFGAVGYDTQLRLIDWAVMYQNRSFGPTLTLSLANQTSGITTNVATGQAYSYTRDWIASAALSYPFKWTYSTLTPSIGVNSQRTFSYVPSLNPTDPTSESRYVPSIDTQLSFSNTESSSLAITAEGGRTLSVGTRMYLYGSQPLWKGVFKGIEYVKVTEHSVLVPAIKAAIASHSDVYSSAAVAVEGRTPQLLINSTTGDSLTRLGIRGYPNEIYYAKSAGAVSLDYRFPLLRIFRGWGTNPAFLEDLFGFAFAETTYFPGAEPGYGLLPSAGLGLRLGAEFLVHVPLVFSLEYHQGFQTGAGGTGELFFHMGFSNFSF